MKLILDLLGALGNVLRFSPSIFLCGLLRQGFDKFYSLSFQARRLLLRSLAQPQLATASLNFGVGRSQSFWVKSTI
jgi:hypothetical protein